VGRERTTRRRRQRRLHHPKKNTAMRSSPYSTLPVRERAFSIHGEAAIVMVLAAVVITLATAYDFARIRHVLDHGVPATATVVGIDHHRRPQLDEPVIAFATRDGVPIQTVVGFSRWQGAVRIGDVRQVIYDPADPGGTVLDTGKKFVHLMHVLGVAAVAFLLPLAVLFWRRGPDLFTPASRRDRAREKGT
jgi:hypothetical protein